ncbi:MAG: hypothetical protein S4CHLAM45_01830 [Chlamydiales bacterium]|nr:hypothetical protein [Chlamydiales bacterium]MCH9619502.1 hypothetical protein [Chlamydiales bacterium]MCH9622306.1 hypothetical protein [Chlamydiales bacterium]
MPAPILTIVITNYNHGCYLPKALDSIVNQQSFPFEILIIDDASTDNSLDVIASYQKRYPFIRLIKHAVNQGVCFSLSEGVDEALGEYVHTMGADDFRLPGFIENTLSILLKHPKIGLACSDFGYIRGKTQDASIQTDRLIKAHKPHVFHSKQLLSLFQTTDFWIPGHTAIFKRKLAIEHKKYHPELQFLCDWFLLHRIALKHGVAYIPQTLSIWWIHSDSYSETLLKDKRKNQNVYNTLFQLLFQTENREIGALFFKSTLLRKASKALFSKIYYKPKYWPTLFYLAKKSILYRLKLLHFSEKPLSKAP